MPRLHQFVFMVLTWAAAALAGAQTANPMGVYIGSFPDSGLTGGVAGGMFALHIEPAGTATLIAHVRIREFLDDLPAGGYIAHIRSFLARDFAVSRTGAFTTTAELYIPTAAFRGGVSTPEPNPRLVILNAASAEGAISAEVFSGNITSAPPLTAALSPSQGPFLWQAGVYAARVANSAAEAHAIVDAMGRIVFQIVTDDTVDGGSGTLTPSESTDIVTQEGATATIELVDDLLRLSLARPDSDPLTFTGVRQNSAPYFNQRFINLSGRGRASMADPAIAGVVVANGSARVMVRSVGPELRAKGVPDAIPAPRLQIATGSTIIITNTSWSSSPRAAQIAELSAALGAFPLPEGSADTAALLDYGPGPFTAIVTPVDDRAGVVLTEAYEDTAFPTTARLSNFSFRALAGAGDNTLIIGFVVRGSAPLRVLLRAAGPALAAYGISQPLARPTLTVFAGATPIASNSRWGTPTVPAAVDSATPRVGAFAFPPASYDAALVLNLAAGVYTAHVTSGDGGTGTALLEVYKVP